MMKALYGFFFAMITFLALIAIALLVMWLHTDNGAQDLQKQLDSCYESADQFHDDLEECNRQKGFEWKEHMELMCSHFNVEEE